MNKKKVGINSNNDDKSQKKKKQYVFIKVLVFMLCFFFQLTHHIFLTLTSRKLYHKNMSRHHDMSAPHY